MDRDRPQIRYLVLQVSNPTYWSNNPVRQLDDLVGPFAILWALDLGQRCSHVIKATEDLSKSDILKIADRFENSTLDPRV